MKKYNRLFLYAVLIFLINSFNISAQESKETATDSNQNKPEELEFSHPLITESISPDTKIRFTFLDTRDNSGMYSQTYDLEMEYAPVPSFSLHLDIPYAVLNPSGESRISNLDNIELDLKFANFAFASHKVLLGYGISFGFPTGSQAKDIGSDHIWDINPFFNGGFMWRKWEWTAFFTFGIPANQKNNENMQTGLESRLTALYHLSPRWQALVEAGNATQISRFYRGAGNYDLTEGIKYKPDPDKPWIIALGAREPLGNNDELKLQGVLSVFYHFKD